MKRIEKLLICIAMVLCTTLIFFPETGTAAVWYAIQGTLEKSTTGELLIKTEKEKYVISAEDLPKDGAKGLVKMVGKQLVATGTISQKNSVKVIQLKTFAEVTE